MCRNAFNNRLRNTDSNFIRTVNSSLRKNRKILEDFCKGESQKVSRQMLIDAGYNFRHLTSIRRSKNGEAYHFCYEYGYLSLDEDTLLIFVSKD
jgi:hypothetical protein